MTKPTLGRAPHTAHYRDGHVVGVTGRAGSTFHQYRELCTVHWLKGQAFRHGSVQGAQTSPKACMSGVSITSQDIEGLTFSAGTVDIAFNSTILIIVQIIHTHYAFHTFYTTNYSLLRDVDY